MSEQRTPFLSQHPFTRRGFRWISAGLLVLTACAFVIPFAFKGTIKSMEKNANNVKDWLPSDFSETTELEWFADYFAGEQFVLSTWPGCTEDDQRLKLLTQKLKAESSTPVFPNPLPQDYERAREMGEKLQLLAPADFQTNWGKLNEKWLVSASGEQYYITPDGKLFRWGGDRSPAPSLVRALYRKMNKNFKVEGQFIAAFGGEPTAAGPNPYYNNPHLLTAPLFRTIETGPDIVKILAKKNGPLWPVAAMEDEDKAIYAKRLAEQRLTGTLFAPAVPADFPWTADAFHEAAGDKRTFPTMWKETIEMEVQSIADTHFDGDLAKLKSADSDVQAEYWNQVYDALGVEPPARQTCIVTTMTPIALENLAFVVGRGVMGAPRGRLLQLAEECGVNAAQPPSASPPPFDRQATLAEPALRMGGPPVDNVSIDEEGAITLMRLIGYCAVIGLVLSMLAFRSLKITLMVFSVGVLSAVIGLACVGYSGQHVDAILMSMPSLVYILGLSGAIHIVNYYREEAARGGIIGAPERALSHAFMPCTLAAVTTAIGLMSLYTSNIIPIRKFGLYSALGVVGTLSLLFIFLPAALHVFKPSPPKKKTGSDFSESKLADWWASVGMWVTGHYRSVGIACMLLLVVTGAGLANTKTSVQLLKLFGAESQIIQDYGWLEGNFGKLVPMELVLRVPADMQREREDDGLAVKPHALSQLERLRAVEHVQRAMEDAFGEHGTGDVGKSMSAVTLMTSLPDPSTKATSATRVVFKSRLADSMQELRDTDYLKIEQEGPWTGSELWRLSLRVGALSDVDYGYFVGSLRETVEPVMEAYRYRDEILDVVGDGSSMVMVVGKAKPTPETRRELLIWNSTDDENAEPSIDQEMIFASTMADVLMDNKRIRELWVPMRTAQQNEEKPLNLDAWGRNFGKVDAVVLLGDDPNFSEEFIREHAKTVIDARRSNWQETTAGLKEGVPDVKNAGPMQVVYTGIVPLVYKAQRTLLVSLVESTCWAFVLIAIVMSGLLNPGTMLTKFKPKNLFYGISAGLTSMLPNVFPVVAIFGLLGYFSSVSEFAIIDLGKMMTASVAMGVAVDDTIHFLEWFRQGLAQGLSRRDAVIESYRRVGPAMTQTTILGGLGLFVFAMSTFTPTQSFGSMMLFLLAAALLGDLVFLPAILVSPLGKLFRPRDIDVLDNSPSPSDSLNLSTSGGQTSPAPGTQPAADASGSKGRPRVDAPETVKPRSSRTTTRQDDTVS